MVLFRVGLVLGLMLGIILGFGLGLVFDCESLLRDLQMRTHTNTQDSWIPAPFCRASPTERLKVNVPHSHTHSIAHREFLKASPTHITELSSHYFPQAGKFPHGPLRVHLFLQPRSSKRLSDRVTNPSRQHLNK